MKNLLSLFFAFFVSFSPASNRTGIDSNNKRIDFNEILEEIEWFIKKTKQESVEEGKYNVYVVRIYEDGENRYCVTMGVIIDSLHVVEVKGFKYFMKLNGELVLLDFSDEFKIKFSLENKSIEPLIDKKIISDKIYPSVVFLGIFPEYVCCFESKNITKKYYWNSGDVPYDKALFKRIPTGEVIKVDSNTMKRMFKTKHKN